MENIASLRRQAAFCLRFAEFCSDEQLANHLQFKAAEYHQRALRSEFNLQHDGAAGTAWFDPTTIGRLQ